MMLDIFLEIDEILRRYTQAYAIANNAITLNVEAMAHVSEDDKEWILSELDTKLPLGVIFTHTYDGESGKLVVTFKDVEPKING